MKALPAIVIGDGWQRPITIATERPFIVPRPRPTVTIALGTGIYPRSDAARLLGITPARLRRWVSGYTYTRRASTETARTRRRLLPLVYPELPSIDGNIALSFFELMELRVVKALVDRDISLRHIRRAAEIATERFDTRHPFASQRVFTDGRDIFSSVTEDVHAPNVVKWRTAEIDQVVAGPIFDQFLSEIEFDAATSLALRWWPKGREVPIVLDPAIRFGAPIIVGTGVRTSTIARLARAGSVRDAAIAYEIDVAQAAAAVAFEQTLVAA